MGANRLIARRFARQGRITSLDGSRWWSAISSAWSGGPLFTAVVPFAIAGAIMRTNFSSVIWAVLYFFWALRSLSEVYSKETK
jgi:hypothetical protein